MNFDENKEYHEKFNENIRNKYMRTGALLYIFIDYLQYEEIALTEESNHDICN